MVSDAVLTAVIGAASGLGGGLVASLVAPWANWSIEKRRSDRQRKRDLVDSWRAGIAAMGEGDSHTDALGTTWYETLRPHMLDETRKKLERPRTFYLSGDSGRGSKDLFTGEVDRIEREWQ